MIRDWLSAMLRGDGPRWTFTGDDVIDEILHAADAEGIVSLLHECIISGKQATDIPPDFKQRIAELARGKAKQSLMREAECRRILAVLQQTGIHPLLLKGSALAYWAYPSAHLRDCSDIDLLLTSRAETEKAIEQLKSLHYTVRDVYLAGDLVSFEQTCIGNTGIGTGLEIDLHWRLSSSPIFAYRFDYDELNSNAISLPRLGENARGLSAIHAFFNASAHRVQNMPEANENRLKWLYDLHLLAGRFEKNDWQTLTQIAIDRQLAGTCLDGLQASRQYFHTNVPIEVLSQLASTAKLERMQISQMRRWLYIQYMSFLAYPVFAERMRWLRQRLLPNRAYMETRYGENYSLLRLIYRRIKAGFRRLF